MSDDKCPFCAEPIVRDNGFYRRYRCGTQGPDINGEYHVGHTCDITTWTRLLAEKDSEIERLHAEAYAETVRYLVHLDGTDPTSERYCLFCEISELQAEIAKLKARPTTDEQH